MDYCSFQNNRQKLICCDKISYKRLRSQANSIIQLKIQQQNEQVHSLLTGLRGADGSGPGRRRGANRGRGLRAGRPRISPEAHREAPGQS